MEFLQRRRDEGLEMIGKLMRTGASLLEDLRFMLSGGLAVDLGTVNTRVYMPGFGQVLDEPSVIALSAPDGHIVAAGRGAKTILSRGPEAIRVIQPLKGGVIAEPDAAGQMLSYFIRQALKQHRILNPRLLICVPGDLTRGERQAVKIAAYRAGARQVSLVEESLAAAAGAGLNIDADRAGMVIDIGGGTIDIAVVGLGGLFCVSTMRLGGMDMDQAIIHHLRRERGYEVGEETAEKIKIELGSVAEDANERVMQFAGRSLARRLPARFTVTSEEIRAAIEPVMQKIVSHLRAVLEQLPPEVSADLLDSGIVLTGGGAQLPGLAKRLRQDTGLSARLAFNPGSAAVLGASRLLKPKIFVQEQRPQGATIRHNAPTHARRSLSD